MFHFNSYYHKEHSNEKSASWPGEESLRKPVSKIVCSWPAEEKSLIDLITE